MSDTFAPTIVRGLSILGYNRKINELEAELFTMRNIFHEQDTHIAELAEIERLQARVDELEGALHDGRIEIQVAIGLLHRWRKVYVALELTEKVYVALELTKIEDGRLFSESGAFCRDNGGIEEIECWCSRTHRDEHCPTHGSEALAAALEGEGK